MPVGQNHSNFALNTRLSSPRYDTWCKIQVIYDEKGKMEKKRELDSVTMKVLGGAFDSICKEMALLQLRMSHCALVTESEDLGCGLFLPDGRQISESGSSPLYCGSIGGYIRGFMDKLGGNLQDGDIIIHNDPYAGAGHSPDVGIIAPVFFHDELIGFTGSTTHWIDIGGAFPGITLGAIDLWAEGKLFRGIKLYEGGKKNQQLWDFIYDNVRTPKDVLGDCEAQIAACQYGRKRFLKIVEKYGLDMVLTAAEEWMNYAETMLRKQIKKIPPGEYYAEGWLDDDGRDLGNHLKVATKVIIEKDGGITVDLTGSAPETETGFNSTYIGSTRIGTFIAVRSIFLDEFITEEIVPQNEGICRPIKVIAPPGTIFNPRFPKSCFARMVIVQRLGDIMHKALSPVLPEHLKSAGSSAHIHWVAYAGYRPNSMDYWVHLEAEAGGSYGGRYGKDGSDAISVLCINPRNTPVEHQEMLFPMRCDRYELREEAPGAGKWRSGKGIIRVDRALVPTIVSCEGGRHYEPPWGFQGGKDGLPGSLVRNTGTDSVESWPSKFVGKKLDAGDTLEIKTPIGGGYGPPVERDPELVLIDVLDDYLTMENAEEQYGVIIDVRTKKIDYEATENRRETLRSLGSQTD
jgi:N-methylhydantoinase B